VDYWYGIGLIVIAGGAITGAVQLVTTLLGKNGSND